VAGTTVEPAEVTASPRQRASEVAALTGLRGFAALTVVVVHASGRTEYPWLGIHDFGPIALFTLSGFLLFGPWARWGLSRGSQPALEPYAVRRALRIFPAYLVALFAMAVMHPASQPVGLDGWLRAITLTGDFSPDGLRPGLEQAWSLGTELMWYVAVPVIGLGIGTLARRLPLRRGLWLSVGLLALSVPITVGYRVFTHDRGLDQQFTWTFWLPSYLACFAAGAVLALLMEAEQAGVVDLGRIRRTVTRPVVVLVASAALIGVGAVFGGPMEYVPASFGERSMRFTSCAVLSILLLAAAAMSGPGGVVGRVLSMRWLVATGRWSYSIYLWHLPVIVLLVDDFTFRSGPAGVVVWLTVVFASSIALGAASYVWVERPAMSLSRRARPAAPGPEVPDQSDRTRSAEVRALTGVRGIAALAVMVGHIAGATTVPWLAVRGLGPVTLFTLSGFLLARPWSRWALGAGPRPGIVVFLRRRALRILPPAWALLLFVPLMVAGSAPSGFWGWVRTMALSANLSVDGWRGGVEHLWSLGTEVQWYAVLPVVGTGLALMCRRLTPKQTVLLAAAATVLAVGLTLAWRIVLGEHDLIAGPWNLWWPAYALNFALGAALAHLAESAKAGVVRVDRLRRLLGSPYVLVPVLVAAVLVGERLGGPITFTPATMAETLIRFASNTVESTLLVAVGALALAAAPTVRLLAQPALVMTGRWSYGIYLWHFPLLLALLPYFDRQSWQGCVELALVVVAVSYALGAATHIWIEKPAIAWSHRP
jgi:peptidoglycan/LPS O-acetylase OafA/YrhL